MISSALVLAALFAAQGAPAPSASPAPTASPASTPASAELSIPSWYPAKLYPKPALENLYNRYDLGPLKASPHLRWRTDPSGRVFRLEVERGDRRESYPVVGMQKGAERNEYLLRVAGPSGERQAVVTLGGRSSSPAETILSRFDDALDGSYAPAMRVEEGGLRVFASADDELAVNGFVGTWAGPPKSERMVVTIASPDPLTLQIGKNHFRVEIDAAPAGLDAIAIPAGSGAAFGVRLFGPDAIDRIPVRCTGPAAARACSASGKPERFHRVGARLNIR